MDPIARRLQPNETTSRHVLLINLIFVGFENVDKKSILSNFEVDRTQIVEVRPERNFIIKCKVILHYNKLNYFSLFEVNWNKLSLNFDEFTKLTKVC